MWFSPVVYNANSKSMNPKTINFQIRIWFSFVDRNQRLHYKGNTTNNAVSVNASVGRQGNTGSSRVVDV